MAAGHSSLNVKSVLDDYFLKTRQRCRAHVVHRLDRDTSGLMIYAKDIDTEQILEHNWHGTVYDRRYVAVVSGEMEDDNGTVRNWLKDNEAYVAYSSPTDNGGKLAVTHFHVWQGQLNTRWWNISWRRVVRIRFVSIRQIWGIPFVETRSMATAIILCTVSVFTPTCCASCILSRKSEWSLPHPFQPRSAVCSEKSNQY